MSNVSPNRPSVIAMLAGEASGDNLGASLIQGIHRLEPTARCIGIGGSKMAEQGFESWFDMTELSVNGFIDPLLRLPLLIKVLLQTRNKVIAAKADCFVGIDFNFFNLLLAGMLKRKGVRTIHYVSPTVWAWRSGRVKSIAKKIDLMLTLYPFETEIYEQNNVQAKFVGHPRADEIDLDEGIAGKASAREAFGFDESDRVIAMLPGSRKREVQLSGPDFFAAAQQLVRMNRKTKFIIPAANKKRKKQIQELVLKESESLRVKVVLGKSQLAMQAADVVLANSGTATLEAMLLKKPMVMSYRLPPLTYELVSRLVTTKFFALPNILSGHKLVEELIQDDATPDALASAVKRLVDRDQSDVIAIYDEIHRSLRQDAGTSAANAILELIQASAEA
jgi:lipid-A-disaccharide synthase